MEGLYAWKVCRLVLPSSDLIVRLGKDMVNILNATLAPGKNKRTTTAMATDPKAVRPQSERPAEAGFRALIRVTGLLDRVMQPYFGRFGISRSQWGVLRILQRVERSGSPGLRLVDLGERLIVRPPSVTGLVSRLERLGYVVRSSSTDDLRGREVSLTAAGRDLIARVLQNHGTQIAAVMGALDSQEQKQLLRLLERLGAHLEYMAEGRADAGTQVRFG
jgi:DNA-binding MarR family transcriptional regulator